MSQESVKYFLCCFCGLQIKKNKYNLDRHEELHAKKVKKIQCSVENCGQTFTNNRNYSVHWQRRHADIEQPNSFRFVYEETKPRKKLSQNREAKIKTPKIHTTDVFQPIDFQILHGVNLIQNVKINNKNKISEMYLSNPWFGS